MREDKDFELEDMSTSEMSAPKSKDIPSEKVDLQGMQMEDLEGQGGAERSSAPTSPEPDMSMMMGGDMTVPTEVAPAKDPVQSAPASPEPDMSMMVGGDMTIPSELAPEASPVPSQPEPDASMMMGGDMTIPAETTSELGEQEVSISDDSHGHSEQRGRIGDLLVERGIITNDQLNVALQEKKITGEMLGTTLVDLGFIEESTLSSFLAETSGNEIFDLKSFIPDSEALTLIDKQTAQRYYMLPITIQDNELRVAMVDPQNVVALDTLRRFIPRGTIIRPLVASETSLNEAIDTAYGYASSIKDILLELEEGAEQHDLTALTDEDSFAHPIVRLVNALVFDAVKMGASDIHIEPEENFVRIRYRLDGVLFNAQILHTQHMSSIIQRIKILSDMNIADKQTPQDGRFGINIGGREADFRVSVLPTVHGENIVIRILDKSSSILPLADLGFSEDNLQKIKIAQSKPEGIIIVTGPTGSGKTTSLYSMLNEANEVDINIQTLEDPVEYPLPMIRQTQVREGVLEFADGVKAMLRQDPDVILVGEVRDPITAEMALKAAMTGHQVYTTLHTNDSFGAIPRIFDLGLKPGMVAGAIVAIFAQRLARKLCVECKEEHVATAYECEILGVNSEDPPTIYKAKEGGCAACMGKGYKGRIAIAEILLFDEELDEMLANNATKAEIKSVAIEKGFKGMRDDAVLKVLDGTCDIEGLSKVVDMRVM